MQRFSAFDCGNTEIAAYQWFRRFGLGFYDGVENSNMSEVGHQEGSHSNQRAKYHVPRSMLFGWKTPRRTFLLRFFDILPILGTAEVFGDTNKSYSAEFDGDSRSVERIRLSLFVVELDAVTRIWEF